MQSLTLTIDGDPPQQISLSDERAMIGRHSSCAVHLRDPLVSRQHAELIWEGDALFLEVRSTANPLRVNGVTLKERQRLYDQDRISLGSHSLRVNLGSADPAGEPATSPEAVAEATEVDESGPCLLYAGNVYPIQGLMILGRLADCAIQIMDQRASRRHLEVGLDESGLPWVRDLGAANGSLVNGKRLGREPQTLAHGDRISVGASHLMLQLPAALRRKGLEPSSENAPGQLSALIGRLVAGYRVQRLLGEGSLAGVFACRQLSLDRDVALKIFRPSVVHGRPEFAQGLLAAARLAGRVEHDHVARIHECGEEADGLLWYSMELVEGESLAQLIDRDGPLGLEPSLIILERICLGLEAAQGQGICHFDLQPSTVLINQDGLVKIVDLGLGQILQEGRQSSDHSMVVGNPAYMSPERCRGEAGDHRSDLYALGCLWHFMVTGFPPYRERNPLAIQRSQQDAPLPSLSAAGLPASTDALLAGMMAKNPEWRFASYPELRAEITQAKSSLGAPLRSASEENAAIRSSRPLAASVSQQRQTRRQKAQYTNLAVAALALLILLLLLPQLLSYLRNLGPDDSTAGSLSEPLRPPPREPRDSRQQRPQDQRVADPDDAQGSWQQLRQRSQEDASRGLWAQAAFAIQRFMRQEQDPEIREAARARLIALEQEAHAWYRQQINSLPDELAQRLAVLSGLRNQVLDQQRADAEARYQEALGQLRGLLADARRSAARLLDHGRMDALPELGDTTLASLLGTPVEALAEQFAQLCQEAQHIVWQGSWPLTREVLRAQVVDPATTADRVLGAAAALMLNADAVAARQALLAHPGLDDEAVRLRRERLLNADALVLAFDSAHDLSFFTLEYGDVLLDRGLRNATTQAEPVALRCITPVSGDSWEIGLELELPPLQGEHRAAISLVEEGRVLFVLQFEEGAISFHGRNQQGMHRQEFAQPSSERLRLRLSARNRSLMLFIDNETQLMDWQIPASDAAFLRLDLASPRWALREMHLLTH